MYPKHRKALLHRHVLSRSFSYAKQRGVGLPATIFLIVIIALIVLALSDINKKSGLGFGQDFYSMKAFYAAESGAQVALNRVFVGAQSCSNALADIDFDDSAVNPGLDQCDTVLNCRQDIVEGITYYTFNSIATCGTGFEQAQRSIEVRARSE